MQSKSEFVIPYLGLSNGEHNYSYSIDKYFWSKFETSKISEGKMQVEVVFDKMDSLVTLYIDCTGVFKAQCDRCVSEILIPIDFKDTVIIKVQESSNQETDVIFLDSKTSHIDLTPLIYESIHVHLPMINLKDCEKDGYKDCDQEILDRLYSNDKRRKNTPSGIWGELDKLNLN